MTIFAYSQPSFADNRYWISSFSLTFYLQIFCSTFGVTQITPGKVIHPERQTERFLSSDTAARPIPFHIKNDEKSSKQNTQQTTATAL
ncbi:MAG TPA: hypothetical protein H9845_07335 [Candidatus Agathobaculum pullicola]|nr:hypothetical protein [Candidatus Agathobaculum pullicola]